MTVIGLLLGLFGGACALWLLRQPESRAGYSVAFFVPLLVAPLIFAGAAFAHALGFGVLWIAGSNLLLVPLLGQELLRAGVKRPMELLGGKEA